ncbi:MAG TPA: carboxypeptidase-like regulatory domain-containing protein [Pseudomonadota bacterium]|nr:carboxypeptidase-like regulatory domain-containing protein [Pseudomonadota bacterium]
MTLSSSSLRASLVALAMTMGPALSLTACGGDPGPGGACPAIAAANFNVVVLDKASGKRICDATVEATDSATSEKVKLDVFGSSTDCAYSGGFYERPGTFSLSVSKTGYTAQTQTGIKVEKGVCNVVSAQVTFSL